MKPTRLLSQDPMISETKLLIYRTMKERLPELKILMASRMLRLSLLEEMLTESHQTVMTLERILRELRPEIVTLAVRSDLLIFKIKKGRTASTLLEKT